MASLFVSVAVAVLTFGFGLLGLYLKRLVPERHMFAGSRDMIGAVIGMLSLLLALVLGTLVGSAYGFLRAKKATSSRYVRARWNWIDVSPIRTRDAAAARSA